jgi:PAS domain S-box-containing protein
VENIPAVLWTTDGNLRLTSLAGAGLTALNVHAHDHLGVALHDLSEHLPANSPPVVAHQRALRGEASKFEVEIMGRALQAHVEPLRGSGGDIVGVIGVALDATERRVAERALQLSEQSYRSLVEEAPYGLCRSTVSGQLLDVNRAMVEMLGHDSEADLLLRNVKTELFAEAERYDEFFGQLEAQRHCQGFECEWRRPDGGTIAVSLGGRAIRDESGGIWYLEIVAENVTERKRLEGELRRARETQLAELQAKNAELDSFVYTVSHDLKAPLVVVHGIAGVLAEDYGPRLDDDARHLLARLQANAEHMERLIEDLLALSRIGREAREPEAVSFDEVVDDFLAEMSSTIRARDIKVVRQGTAELWGVRSQIEQVMRNLLGNAVKYLGDTETPLIEVGARDAGSFVECHVKDNGIGIDPAYHGKVFEIFHRLQDVPAEGTGVGLAIVKKIVENAGGRIWIESVKGHGATFHFTWPVKPGARGGDAQLGATQ